MDAFLAPVPMTVIVVLYVYGQLRSLIGWEGTWRGLSMLVLFGELLWIAYANGSEDGLVLASFVLGCLAGLVILAALHLVRVLLRRIH